MDIERALVSATLKQKCVAQLADQRFGPDLLVDEDHALALAWIFDYWHKYAKSPTIKAFTLSFPSYQRIKVEEPINFLMDETRKRRAHAIYNEAMYEATRAMEEDEAFDSVTFVRDRLARALSEAEIVVTPTTDMELSSTWKARLRDYDERRADPDALRGITTGLAHIDRSTGGMHAEQLITFVGMPKAGKSTMLIWMALKAQASGKKGLFIGFEMSNKEQYERHDSLVSGVNLKRLQEGLIDDEEREQVRKALRKRQNMPPLVLVADPSGTATISGVRAKIEQYQPDFVIVDGCYLMDDEIAHEPPMTPRHLTNITRGMKRLAQSMKLPVVISTQVIQSKVRASSGITADAIGYSSSFAQDSDTILGVENQADTKDSDGDGIGYKQVRVVLARNSRNTVVKFTINWRAGEIVEYEAEDWTDDMEKTVAAVASLGLAADSEYAS